MTGETAGSMMKQSDAIDKLAGALAKAQGEVENAQKDTENPFFHSKYADLASVIAAMRAPFAAAGLAIHQGPRDFGSELRLVTRIIHQSGQWIEDDGYPLLTEKRNMQGLGSATTYARRYGLMAAAGIAPAEDDDGNNAARGKGRDGKPIAGASRKKGDFSGVPIMKLKERAREIAAAMNDCETLRDFDELVAVSQETLNQLKADLPDWWYTDANSDVLGIEDRIAERRQKLQAKAEFELAPAGMLNGPLDKSDTGEPVKPGAEVAGVADPQYTEDGMLAVPQTDGVVLWALWCDQLEAFEIDKAKTEADVESIWKKYAGPMRNLKRTDEGLHKALVDAFKAAKEAINDVTEPV